MDYWLWLFWLLYIKLLYRFYYVVRFLDEAGAALWLYFGLG